VPFVFSGFWSKEAILHAAHGWTVSALPFYFGLIAVVLTAFYMTRLVAETFFGPARTEAASHAHESPRSMTLPLVVLAIGAIVLGFLGTPYWPWLQRSLDPSFQTEPGGYGVMIFSIMLVALGLGSGWAIYGRKPRVAASAADPLGASMPGVFSALAARLGFDELYAATFGRANTALGVFANGLDRWVWDGVVKFLTQLSQFAGWVNRETDEDVLNGGFDATSEKLRGTGQTYSRAQSGEPHGYLRMIAIGFVLLVLAVMFGGRT
jgi:NADH-quinone oxidoreductase subunit L